MHSESSTIETKIAKAVSYIFHPVFYPILGLYFFFNSGTYIDTMNEDGKNFLYTIVAFTTCALPLLSMPVFVYRRMVRNIEMDNRSERIFPLAFILIFYSIGYFLVRNLPLPLMLAAYIAAITILAAITLFITIWWKISLHLIGIGGLLGSLIAVSLRLNAGIQNYIIGVVLLAGIVATSRLLLKVHTGWQLISGFIVGFGVCFAWIYFY